MKSEAGSRGPRGARAPPGQVRAPHPGEGVRPGGSRSPGTRRRAGWCPCGHGSTGSSCWSRIASTGPPSSSLGPRAQWRDSAPKFAGASAVGPAPRAAVAGPPLPGYPRSLFPARVRRPPAPGAAPLPAKSSQLEPRPDPALRGLRGKGAGPRRGAERGGRGPRDGRRGPCDVTAGSRRRRAPPAPGDRNQSTRTPGSPRVGPRRSSGPSALSIGHACNSTTSSRFFYSLVSGGLFFFFPPSTCILQILCRCHPRGYLADWLEEGNGRGDSGQLQSFEPLVAEAS